MIRAAASIPSLDGAFFDEIRSTVQAQIKAQETLSSPFNGIFRRKLAYAATFTLLLFACSSVVFMRFNRTASDSGGRGYVSFRQDMINPNGPPEISYTVRSVAAPAQRENPLSRVASSLDGARRTQATNRNTLLARQRLAQSSRMIATAPPQSQFAVLIPRVDEMTGANESLGDDSARQQVAHTLPTDTGDAQDQTLRIEFQTSDPTIRIVWLTPRTNDAPPVTPTN